MQLLDVSNFDKNESQNSSFRFLLMESKERERSIGGREFQRYGSLLKCSCLSWLLLMTGWTSFLWLLERVGLLLNETKSRISKESGFFNEVIKKQMSLSSSSIAIGKRWSLISLVL